MNRVKRIENILHKHLIDFKIKIIDKSYLHKGHNNFDGKEETHITLLINSDNSNKINRLDIHKKINSLLKDEFEAGMHALEIKINL